MHKWKRGENRHLSQHFVTFEFECQCGKCEDQQISEILISRLESLRSLMGKPLKITSGFRCHAHQLHLASLFETAKGVSQHELGSACDILVEGHDKKRLITTCKTLFRAVGIAKTFIHLDLRMDKIREWFYT